MSGEHEVTKVVELSEGQLEVLASPAVTEVFECFSATTAHSIPDVAKEIHRSQAAVGVHVDALVAVGLLKVVGSRKKRSRIERLFVRTAHEFLTNFQDKGPSYHAAAIEGFNASMRRAARMHELYRERVEADFNDSDFGLMLARSMHLSRAGTRRLQEMLHEFYAQVKELEAADTPGTDAERIRISLMFHPTVASSQTKLRASKKAKR